MAVWEIPGAADDLNSYQTPSLHPIPGKPLFLLAVPFRGQAIQILG